jgi:putative redox protein
MVRIEMKYEGDLHCIAVHTPSTTQLSTDAPRDNQGKGESFSPTDLVATALGTCILTTMGILARTLSLNVDGATATVEKEMTSTAPRMIASLATVITMPGGFDELTQQKLERAAHTCPVHRSLHPDVNAPIIFVWQ